MQLVILAGGMQSTLARTGENIPKPMIEIGGKPLIWHIMKHFSQYGIKDFIICGGYKVSVIKEYFTDFYIYESDITVDLSTNEVTIHNKKTEDWRVTVLDTGHDASALSRIQHAIKWLDDEFIVTYGDCLSDINIEELILYHTEQQKDATLVLAKPSGRKQIIQYDETESESPAESIKNNNAWISGDCYIFKKRILEKYDFLQIDEQSLFERLNADRELSFYSHTGYLSAIETMRDLVAAEQLWENNVAPWVTDI